MSSLELLYRPNEFDDWGFIRNPDGSVYAVVKRPISRLEAEKHRGDKTDPYKDLALDLITARSKDALIAKLTEALEPFAAEADARKHLAPGPDIDHWPIGGSSLTFGHLRLALAALSLAKSEKQL